MLAIIPEMTSHDQGKKFTTNNSHDDCHRFALRTFGVARLGVAKQFHP
jgi:hypothetical protein